MYNGLFKLNLVSFGRVYLDISVLYYFKHHLSHTNSF